MIDEETPDLENPPKQATPARKRTLFMPPKTKTDTEPSYTESIFRVVLIAGICVAGRCPKLRTWLCFVAVVVTLWIGAALAGGWSSLGTTVFDKFRGVVKATVKKPDGTGTGD
eukprot:TRINITY_DN66922_c4_g1_i4.p1 TRINITY_DN66922_c4_g1~~TRINITY_DN66922_c4_g1_i4.p1  ORF type:complete len:113 (-),score=9.17 TRINITY_DN66922_c4_g1_i4:969-1307(-)